MKFYDRTTELQILEKNWQQSENRSMMTTLVGRRRIGKTALLLKSMHAFPSEFSLYQIRMEGLSLEDM